ncbi:MAG: NAD(P)-binding domain-containing protein [bacterium]|nr:NAD(P)-binding domain-containing protein [bacterium]
MKTKNIGVIGSGDVGKILADGFLKYGHRVMMGTRNVLKLTKWKEKAGEKGMVGSFADTAAFGDIIVLVAKGTAVEVVLEQAGAANLAGKTIIDAANPIADAAPENGVLKFFTDINSSLMEKLQAAFPDAHFVKAFNSIGSPFMVNPVFRDGIPTMFICGNNEDAKREVAEIVELFGFDVEDMGGAEAARAIEPLCMLWCIPGLLRNDWGHAFKLLKL